MNSQEIGFTEIMQIILYIFFAALLLGFIIAVIKVIYEFINQHIKNQVKSINYKKEAQKLVSKLADTDDIKHLDIYKGHNEDDNDWEYYYQITGKYKGNKFWICINKMNGSKPEAEIRNHVTDELELLEHFLKTITPLKFTLS